MRIRVRPHIIFVTGTSTGVGKTLVSCLLLRHLQLTGVNACALKPISCGDRGDGLALYALQRNSLSLEQINPVHFSNSLSPWMASRLENRRLHLAGIAGQILSIASSFQITVVEGVGGLLTPLNQTHSNLTLIQRLDCPCILVSANELGAINQCRMGFLALQSAGLKEIKVVLSQRDAVDQSGVSNQAALCSLLGTVQISSIPNIYLNTLNPTCYDSHVIQLKKSLARLLCFANF